VFRPPSGRNFEYWKNRAVKRVCTGVAGDAQKRLDPRGFRPLVIIQHREEIERADRESAFHQRGARLRNTALDNREYLKRPPIPRRT
jgi:hypothetical protein